MDPGAGVGVGVVLFSHQKDPSAWPLTPTAHTPTHTISPAHKGVPRDIFTKTGRKEANQSTRGLEMERRETQADKIPVDRKSVV